MTRAPAASVDVAGDVARSSEAFATAVVVAFHRTASLRALLDRLVAPDLAIVVVNVEADRAVRAVAEACGARVVDLLDNPGYAAAVNRGVGVAATNVVIFLNDDARMELDAVRRLAAVIATGVVDVAVPRVVDANGTLERTIAAVPTPLSLAREWLLLPDRPVDALGTRVAVEKWRAPSRPERIDAAAAIVVATTRALVGAVPVPEDYFLYWEESEWFWRLRERGTVVQYRPEIECMHVGGRDDVRPEKSRLLARNAVRCVRRTQGRSKAAAAYVVVVAWNARLVAVDVLRAACRPGSARRERLAARWAGLGAACSSWREIR